VKQPSKQSVEKFSLSFSKGVRNRSHGVFANQYWKCSCACRSVLEVLSVSHACRSRPMVVDLVSPSNAPGNMSGILRLQIVSGNMFRKPHLLFSINKNRTEC